MDNDASGNSIEVEYKERSATGQEDIMSSSEHQSESSVGIHNSKHCKTKIKHHEPYLASNADSRQNSGVRTDINPSIYYLNAAENNKGNESGANVEHMNAQRINSDIIEPGSPSSLTTPLLCRVDRLDLILAFLEEKQNHFGGLSSHSTPTPNMNGQSGLAASDELSPKSLEKRCKPIRSVLEETEAKGTLVERVEYLENRVLKLSQELERVLSYNHSTAATENTLSSSGHLKGLIAFDTVEEKHEVLPKPEALSCTEERIQKGLHEHFSVPKLQENCDVDERKDDDALQMGRRSLSFRGMMEGAYGIEKEDKDASKEEKNASHSKGGKRKLKHLLPACIFPHSGKY